MRLFQPKKQYSVTEKTGSAELPEAVPLVKVVTLMECIRKDNASSNATAQEVNRALLRFFFVFFLELRHELRRMRILPDLIEFYLWIHLNLGHLLTQDKALEYSVKDIINMKTLTRRFADAHSRHIVLLWGRVMDGYNSFLESQGGNLRAGACGREKCDASYLKRHEGHVLSHGTGRFGSRQ